MKVTEPNEPARHLLGATIAGRYRVERLIGEGAMGVVVLARHLQLDRAVAIKFLRPELRREPGAVARIAREGELLARIQSDHVARVLDAGTTAAVGPFLVMEYLEGTDLETLLAAEGPLPVGRAVELVLQVCEALAAAHAAGISHRDIKPQNLFSSRHGGIETIKVLDFGIAQDERGAGAPPASGAQAVPLYGTPAYMSPERIRREPTADHRADIWSVGIVLHELITGRSLFDAPTLTETCARVVSDTRPALETNNAVLPRALRRIIARCLEPEPSRRYQSAGELGAALAPLARRRERSRGRSSGAFSGQPAQEQLALSNTLRAAPPPENARARSAWSYAMVALAGALSLAVAASFRSHLPPLSSSPADIQAEPLAPNERHAVSGVDEPGTSAIVRAAPAPNPAAPEESKQDDSIQIVRASSLEPVSSAFRRERAVHSKRSRAAERQRLRRERLAAQPALSSEAASDGAEPGSRSRLSSTSKSRLRRAAHRKRLSASEENTPALESPADVSALPASDSAASSNAR